MSQQSWEGQQLLGKRRHSVQAGFWGREVDRRGGLRNKECAVPCELYLIRQDHGRLSSCKYDGFLRT